MTFEHNEGQGSLFKNDYKKKDDHPDYKGTVRLSGKDYDIAAWIKEGKKGKFMSLKISKPWQKGYPDLKESPQAKQRTAWRDDLPDSDANSRMDLDDEIPF